MISVRQESSKDRVYRVNHWQPFKRSNPLSMLFLLARIIS